jgi:hypothetical protein
MNTLRSLMNIVESASMPTSSPQDTAEPEEFVYEEQDSIEEEIEQPVVEEESNLQEYDTRSANSKAITAKLKELGYTKIGGGLDASVWSKDAGSVIKIIMPAASRAQDADDVFLAFYNFCQAHKGSPYLPKFVDIGGANHTVFEINGRQYRQIAMEKLAPIEKGSIMEKLVWGLSDMAKVPLMKWSDAKAQLSNDEFWQYFSKKSNQGPMHAAQVKQALTDPQVEKEYAGLFNTMQQLWLNGRKKGLGWDLHTENVLQRNGVPVIIDPYS